MAAPGKRMKYDASFKLEVVAYAISTNNCAAAREYGVNEKLVRDWKKGERSVKKIPKKRCATRNRVCYWPQLEHYLEGWVNDIRQQGHRITRKGIRAQALQWAKTHPGESKNFKATINWCSRFMNRKNLVLRQKTKIDPELPAASSTYDSVHGSGEEWLTESQDCEQMEDKIQSSEGGEEDTEDDLEYQEMHSSSHSSASSPTQEDPQIDMDHALDFRLVKQEPSDSLCEDTGHSCPQMVDMAGCSVSQDETGNSNTELTVTGNVSQASSDADSQMSEDMHTAVEIDANPLLTEDKLQFHNKKTGVKHAQISDRSLNFNVDSASSNPQRLQIPSLPDLYDPIANEGLGTCKVGELYEHPDLTEAGYLNYDMRVCSNDQMYKCDDCGASFFQIGDLMYHMKLHSIEKPYKCDICGALFTHPDSLKCHRSTHTGEKPYRCDICGASFAVNSYLRSHMRTHASEKHFKCDVCDASFAQCTSLKLHKRIHTGERPFSCDVCDAYFARAGNLRYHKRIHTGERPYQCNVCSVSFTLSNHLKSHMRTHTGEKPYICEVCSASFAQCTSLKTHMRTHTGEKPYTCDVCGACFARADILKCHKKSTHK